MLNYKIIYFNGLNLAIPYNGHIKLIYNKN